MRPADSLFHATFDPPTIGKAIPSEMLSFRKPEVQSASQAQMGTCMYTHRYTKQFSGYRFVRSIVAFFLLINNGISLGHAIYDYI